MNIPDDGNVYEHKKLTRREVDVIRLVIEGKTSKDVGRILNVASRTVSFHLENIFDKLYINNRTQLCNLVRTTTILDKYEI